MAIREAERQLAEQAEASYEQMVKDQLAPLRRPSAAHDGHFRVAEVLVNQQRWASWSGQRKEGLLALSVGVGSGCWVR